MRNQSSCSYAPYIRLSKYLEAYIPRLVVCCQILKIKVVAYTRIILFSLFVDQLAKGLADLAALYVKKGFFMTHHLLLWLTGRFIQSKSFFVSCRRVDPCRRAV